MEGFTLVEILVIIVVLAILAAVVLYALGGITQKSAQAACRADGATVSSAISDLDNEYPNVFESVASTSATSAENLLLGTAYGGPVHLVLAQQLNALCLYGEQQRCSSNSDRIIGDRFGPAVAYAGPSSCPSTIG